MQKETQQYLLEQIKENFLTFGDGQKFESVNKTALALQDGPLSFAAGVDVAKVVELVLCESGHQELVDACGLALNWLSGSQTSDDSCVTVIIALREALPEKGE